MSDTLWESLKRNSYAFPYCMRHVNWIVAAWVFWAGVAVDKIIKALAISYSRAMMPSYSPFECRIINL